MKNLRTLGTILNKNEQKAINGGAFYIPCLGECYDNHLAGSAEFLACTETCRLVNGGGGTGGGGNGGNGDAGFEA